MSVTFIVSATGVETTYWLFSTSTTQGHVVERGHIQRLVEEPGIARAITGER